MRDGDSSRSSDHRSSKEFRPLPALAVRQPFFFLFCPAPVEKLVKLEFGRKSLSARRGNCRLQVRAPLKLQFVLVQLKRFHSARALPVLFASLVVHSELDSIVCSSFFARTAGQLNQIRVGRQLISIIIVCKLANSGSRPLGVGAAAAAAAGMGFSDRRWPRATSGGADKVRTHSARAAAAAVGRHKFAAHESSFASLLRAEAPNG